MGKVCIYARVLTVDRQDFTRQVSDCKTAIGNKYSDNDIEIFGEQISGYKTNESRPGLTRLLNIIENDNKYFDCIYVTEISRLGRDPRETRNLIDNLTDKKIPIYITSINRMTLDDNGERDSIMNIIIQVLMEFADSESKTMKKRSKSGLLQSVVDGKAGGSKNLAYGYTKDHQKLLIVEDEEAEVIKEIFDLYKKGNGCKKIAGLLNKAKVLTRTNKAFGTQLMKFNTEKTADQVIWVDKTIDEIIKNPIYKGLRRFKGNLYPAPAIISAQLFDECNYLMKSKTHSNHTTKYNYLLKDLLTCACCGRNYFAKYKPVPQGDKVYICSSRLIKAGNCGNVGVNITYLESAIYDVLISSRALVKYINKTDDLKDSIIKDLEKYNNQLLLEENEIKKVNTRIARLIDLYEDSNMSVVDFNTRKDKHQKTLDVLIDKVSIINKSVTEKNNMLLKIEDVNQNDYLANLTTNRTEIISIFKQFIKNIYIKKLSNGGDVLLDIHIAMAKNAPNATIKLILDINSMRSRNNLQYAYKMIVEELATTYDDKGILLTSDDEIYKPFTTSELGQFNFVVPEQNILVLGKD